MSGALTTARSSWRDFLNRREPGARWMLVLLVLLAAVELFMLAGHQVDPPVPAAPGRFIPLILTLAAILTSRWWSLPTAPAFPDPRFEVPAAARRWIWLMAGAVAILAMWPRSARLDHGLSTTELQNLDSACRFSRAPAPAEVAEWAGPAGTHSLVLDHVAAQFAGNYLHQNPRLNSTLTPRTARALPWTAGVLSAGLVVLLAAALGSPRAGLAAGLIMAMHPQQVQISSEVSDASLTQFCFGAVLLCLLNAMRTNGWRWWVALGAALAALGFGHPIVIMVVFVLNGVAAVVFWKSQGSKRDRISHALRLLVVTAIAATTLVIPNCFLPVFTSSPALADQWANVLSGVPFSIGADHSASGASLLAMTNEAAWRWPVMFILLPLVMVGGVWFLLRQGWRTRITAVAFLLFGALGGLGPGLMLLPIVFAWAGVGLLRLFPMQPRLQHAPVFIAVLYVLATTPALQRTISIPRQPLREVLAAASSATKATPAIATFGSGPTYLLSRVAGVHDIEKPGELDTLIDTAFEKSLPLFVFYSLADGTDARFEPLAHMLETSGQFVLTHEFPAFDPRQNIRLYRYQPREQIIRLNLQPEKK